MAMLQDQNINIDFDGASLFGKNDTYKALKKGGGLGGRKTLNDISNSAKSSSLQASKKNYTSVISIGKYLNATKDKFTAETKYNFAKVHDKGGRKALTDLTNSRKPLAKQGSKKGLDKKLSAASAANIRMLVVEGLLSASVPKGGQGRGLQAWRPPIPEALKASWHGA
uniref:Uncharacterized protein n=1 Tax=Solanum tuberosum TaxID=4113 RepID=M1BFB3_SOLTU